jgi:hypothetical protein
LNINRIAHTQAPKAALALEGDGLHRLHRRAEPAGVIERIAD